MESLGDWQRSCYCGEPRVAQVGQQLTVMGWVHSRRDHGGVTFIDVRDRSGLVQIVCNPQVNKTAHARAKGFLQVASSPLTRSSYHAGKDFAEMKAAREAQLAKAAAKA